MPRYYIMFKKLEGTQRDKTLILTSDLTGLIVTQPFYREEPMYFPTKEAALLIVNRFLEKGLPPGWKVSVEKEEETDFIVSIKNEEIEEIFNVLAEGIY